MSNKLTPMMIKVTLVNEHIMRLRIRHSLGVDSLVSVYAPTEASDLTVKDAFYAAGSWWVVTWLSFVGESLAIAGRTLCPTSGC